MPSRLEVLRTYGQTVYEYKQTWHTDQAFEADPAPESRTVAGRTKAWMLRRITLTGAGALHSYWSTSACNELRRWKFEEGRNASWGWMVEGEAREAPNMGPQLLH